MPEIQGPTVVQPFGRTWPQGIQFGRGWPQGIQFGRTWPQGIQFGRGWPQGIQFGRGWPQGIQFDGRIQSVDQGWRSPREASPSGSNPFLH